MSALTDYVFSDEDIDIEHANESIIEFHSPDTSYPVFDREDVIAMANHFKIKPSELT